MPLSKVIFVVVKVRMTKFPISPTFKNPNHNLT